MIQLKENKSKIWFKILQADATPIDGSSEVWTMPYRERKGELTTFPGESSRNVNAQGEWYINPILKSVSWLVSNPTTLYKPNSNLKIYVAQLIDAPIYEEPGMIWVHRAYLLREATNLDLKPFGLFRAFSQILG